MLSSVPYKQSMELIENNEEIKDYLGDDFKQVGLITGSISSNGNSSGKAIFSYRVKGKMVSHLYSLMHIK